MLAEYIVKKAAEVLAISGIRDPFEAARIHNVKCNFKDIGTLKGAYFELKSAPVIVINESLDANMQKIVCAHELGHHFLHPGKVQNCSSMSCCTNSGIMEREANIFAAAFLLDPKRIKELLEQGASVYECAAALDTDKGLVEFFLDINNIPVTTDSNFLK